MYTSLLSNYSEIDDDDAFIRKDGPSDNKKLKLTIGAVCATTACVLYSFLPSG